MFSQVRQRRFDCLPPLFVRRLREHHGHRLLRGVAENPRGLAVGVAINLAAFRIAARNRNTRQLQRPRIGDGQVTIDAIQKYRMPGRNFIQIPAAGQSFHRPSRLVPSSTQNPFPGLGLLHLGQQALAEFIERLHSG